MSNLQIQMRTEKPGENSIHIQEDIAEMVQIVITRPAKISDAWLPILTASSIFHESQTRLPNVPSSYFEPSTLLTPLMYQWVKLPHWMSSILAFLANREQKTQKGEEKCSRLHHKQRTHFESRFSPHQTVLSSLSSFVLHCVCQAAGHFHPRKAFLYSSIPAFPEPGMYQPQCFSW